MVPVITVSASYGAGGSVVAPRLAERLGVPFLNRPLSAGEVEGLSRQVGEDAHEDDLRVGLWGRVLEAFATMPDEVGNAPLVRDGGPANRVRLEAEQRLHEFAARGGGGVVLGWAGGAVLEDAYRVRLDGPTERRVRHAMAIEGLSEAAARERMRRTDEIRRVYWRRLYGLDWRDPLLFHLNIDGTAHDTDTVVEIIARALDGFRGG